MEIEQDKVYKISVQKKKWEESYFVYDGKLAA